MLLQWGNKHLAKLFYQATQVSQQTSLWRQQSLRLSYVVHLLYEFHTQEQTRRKSTAVRQGAVKT